MALIEEWSANGDTQEDMGGWLIVTAEDSELYSLLELRHPGGAATCALVIMATPTQMIVGLPAQILPWSYCVEVPACDQNGLELGVRR